VKIPLPSQEALRALLEYDDATGRLTWRSRPTSMFEGGRYAAERMAAMWNKKHAGREAFTSRDAAGYRNGCVLSIHTRAHRVIWKLKTGDDPPSIDHIDGQRDNNRWSNLRGVSFASNMRNQKLRATNKSGVTGVRFDLRRKKWRAEIMFCGRTYSLGEYKNYEEAVCARSAGEHRFGFHPNHGRRK
jgi:hypothetical protein